MIEGKYRIEKTDGTPVSQDARYFVLRIDWHGKAETCKARLALEVYAMMVGHDTPEGMAALMMLQE